MEKKLFLSSFIIFSIAVLGLILFVIFVATVSAKSDVIEVLENNSEYNLNITEKQICKNNKSRIDFYIIDKKNQTVESDELRILSSINLSGTVIMSPSGDRYMLKIENFSEVNETVTFYFILKVNDTYQESEFTFEMEDCNEKDDAEGFSNFYFLLLLFFLLFVISFIYFHFKERKEKNKNEKVKND